MQIQYVMLMVSLILSTSSLSHATQLPTPDVSSKTPSIIKNVAASMKNNEKLSTNSKQTTLDQLLKNLDSHKALPSREENLVMTKITSPATNTVLTGQNKTLSSFIQHILGS